MGKSRTSKTMAAGMALGLTAYSNSLDVERAAWLKLPPPTE